MLVLGTWFFEHLYCTNSDILLLLFLMTNVLIASHFGLKRLDVNVTVGARTLPGVRARPGLTAGRGSSL